jgi:hypothetical protein
MKTINKQGIAFNYRIFQGQPVVLKQPKDEIDKLERDLTNSIIANYNESLVNPIVEVIVSNDGTKIIRFVLTADGRLN